MTADPSLPSGPPYGVETVRQLAELMTEHDLSEIELGSGPSRLRLRRGATAAAPAPAARAAAPIAEPAQAPAAEAPKSAKKLIEIKSEGPGLYYAQPKQGAEPYVRLGSIVTPTTVVGQIGAMKIFTEILAACSGTIAEILVENESPVEYGTVLFRVDPG